jgi:hypothetical protein
VLGSDLAVSVLVPLLLRLLKDASPQVPLNAIAHLETFRGVVEFKMLAHAILPAIQELSQSRAWRVR